MINIFYHSETEPRFYTPALFLYFIFCSTDSFLFPLNCPTALFLQCNTKPANAFPFIILKEKRWSLIIIPTEAAAIHEVNFIFVALVYSKNLTNYCNNFEHKFIQKRKADFMKISFYNPPPPASMMQRKNNPVTKIMDKFSQSVRRDTVELSHQGKNSAQKSSLGSMQNDRLTSLMERKDYLTQLKNNLIHTAHDSDSNTSPETMAQLLKDQIKVINDQLTDVDKQMNELMAARQKEAIDGKDGEKKPDEAKTKEEAQAKQLDNIVKAQDNFSTMAELRLTKAEMTRTATHLSQWSAGEYNSSAVETSDQKLLTKLEVGIENLAANHRELLSENQNIADEMVSQGAAPTEPTPTEPAAPDATGNTDKTPAEKIEESVQQAAEEAAAAESAAEKAASK